MDPCIGIGDPRHDYVRVQEETTHLIMFCFKCGLIRCANLKYIKDDHDRKQAALSAKSKKAAKR